MPAVPVVSIRDALTRMGAQAIRNLVASLAVQRVFLPTKPNEVRLRQHSVYAAVAAAMIAETASDRKIDPAEAYLVGFLHDIGRFVMFEHAAPNLLKVDESHWEAPDQQANLLPASLLAAGLDRIHIDSQALLSGLGFNYRTSTARAARLLSFWCGETLEDIQSCHRRKISHFTGIKI
jgi:hypothetical protein